MTHSDGDLKSVSQTHPHLQNDSWLARAMGLVSQKLQDARIQVLSAKIVHTPDAVEDARGWKPAVGIVKTPYWNYLVKGEHQWWRTAGVKTGYFTGAGISLNAQLWKDIYNSWEGKGKLLYHNSILADTTVLAYSFTYIRDFRHAHTLKTGEKVIMFATDGEPVWDAMIDNK